MSLKVWLQALTSRSALVCLVSDRAQVVWSGIRPILIPSSIVIIFLGIFHKSFHNHSSFNNDNKALKQSAGKPNPNSNPNSSPSVNSYPGHQVKSESSLKNCVSRMNEELLSLPQWFLLRSPWAKHLNCIFEAAQWPRVEGCGSGLLWCCVQLHDRD